MLKMDEIQLWHDWKHEMLHFLIQYSRLPWVFSRVVKYVLMLVHAHRDEIAMVTSSNGGKQKRTKTLIDYNFVKTRMFDEEKDENDQGLMIKA